MPSKQPPRRQPPPADRYASSPPPARSTEPDLAASFSMQASDKRSPMERDGGLASRPHTPTALLMAAADRAGSRQFALIARRIGRGGESGDDVASGVHALSVHRVVRQRVLRGGVPPTDRRCGRCRIIALAHPFRRRDGLACANDAYG